MVRAGSRAERLLLSSLSPAQPALPQEVLAAAAPSLPPRRAALPGELRSLASPAAFEALCEKAAKIEWVVHVKPPFGGPQRVLKYLARYTHRVAISNHRLRALENGRVSFEWKDYAHHGQRKTHDLRCGRVHAPLLTPRAAFRPGPHPPVRLSGQPLPQIETCNCAATLLAVRQTPAPADSHDPADTNVPDRSSCPICKLGRLIMIEVIHPERATSSGHFMTLSRDLSSSSFYIPRRVSADLCLHVATQRVQVCSTASPAILIVARIPSHDSNCAAFRHSERRDSSAKTPFNTPVDSVPAQFNEFYRQCSRRPYSCSPKICRP